MKSQTTTAKLGGLGANVGSEDWQKAQRKKEMAAKYADTIRLNNLQQPLPKKQRPAPVKEKTAREKALEFAKNNVPKPKPKSQAGSGEGGSSDN